MTKNIRITIALTGIATALSSCTTTGNVKVSKAPPPDRITVAVRQFTGGADLDEEGSSGLAEFERIYLPGRLVDRLARIPTVTGAYYASGATSATDFVVDGSIEESNGRDLALEVRVERVEGAQVMKKTYRLRHEEDDTAAIQSGLTRYFDSIAADVAAVGRETRISPAEARAMSYAGNARLAINPAVVNDAAVAGEIERDEILAKG